LKRREDPALITGRGRYIDDLKFEGMLFCAFVRSPYANAKVRSVQRPNDQRLVDFLDGKDVASLTKPCSVFEMGERKFERYAIASEKVHHVGEIVAAVLARTRGEAEDLAELVEVDYISEKPVIDIEESAKGGSKAIDSWDNNIAFSKTIRIGDFDGALANSAHHFEVESRIERQMAAPIEPRGSLAIYDEKSQEFLIWASSKNYHMSRTQAANYLKVPEENVQVKVPDIGGGFGVKGYFYPEEVVTCLFSKRSGRPVKWISTRSEDFLGTMQARDQIHRSTICFDTDLKITGFKDEFLIDIGTPGGMSFSPTQRLLPLLSGCYKIPNLLVDYKGVVTNKPQMGPVRGNGRPEAILAIEKSIEHAARELKIDPVDLRKKNLIKPEELPYNNQLGSFYDSGDYPSALEDLCKAVEYDKLRAWQKEERSKGRVIGIGMTSYVEDTGIGPSSKIGRPFYETAAIRVERDGFVTASSGSSPHGQGYETIYSKIVSDELGVPQEKVRVLFGDTTLIPYGVGSFGSRSAAVAGSAMLLCARAIKEKMISIASNLLNCKKEEVVPSSGNFSFGGKGVTFNQVAQAAYVPTKTPLGTSLGLSAEYFYDPPALTYAYGAVLCVVEINRESAFPKILKLAILDDCGKILDHDEVEGQVQGGVAHAVGNAMLEEIKYNSDGQPLSSNFLDYLLPTSLDIPDMMLLHKETISKMNPLGVKGAGEGGTIGAFGAIVNAVCDAIDGDVLHIPVQLDEILQKLNSSRMYHDSIRSV
jgi:carbon-monoxide dehydrogenase large subunit